MEVFMSSDDPLLWRPLPPIPRKPVPNALASETSVPQVPVPQKLDHVALHCSVKPSERPSMTPDRESGSSVSSVSTPSTVSAVEPPQIESVALAKFNVTSRFNLEDSAKIEEVKEGENLYDEDWADYYFDERNFKDGKNGAPDLPALYEDRKLSLDGHHGALDEPHELPAQEWDDKVSFVDRCSVYSFI